MSRRRATGRSAASLAAGLAAVLIGAVGCTGQSAPSNPPGPPGRARTAASPAPEKVLAAGSLPADRIGPPTAACATVQRPTGWIAAENKKPGDDGWKAAKSPDTLVNGYLGEVSAACGDLVDLHVAGYVSSASVTAYRIGWYGGKGGRAVWRAADVPVAGSGAGNAMAPSTVEESWPVSDKIKITPDWTPGYYLIVVTAGDGHGSAIPLVIRDGSGPSGSGTAPLLFQASVLTYQAYNLFGGYSLYAGPDGKSATRARVASFDRPYADSGYAAPFMYDIPLAQRIEQIGLDADYTTDIDVDQRPSQVAAHQALIVGGHSEYWTRRMYDAADYARDHGVNIAFFGANTVYWHARLEPSPAGPDRRMVVYRAQADDPLAAADPSRSTTEWRSPPLNRPEAGLVGADFGELGTTGGGFRVLAANSWIFAGTGEANGRVLKASLGGEWDTVKPEVAVTPPDIDVIAAAPIVWLGSRTMATMSYYTAPSGAGVFAGGTTYWPCQLAMSCHDFVVDPGSSRVLTQMTDNVLRAFAAGPAGQLHPSVRSLAPSADALISTAATPGDVAVRAK